MGDCWLSVIKEHQHSMGYAEVGYGLAESHHGKGIATAAIRLLVEKFFTKSPVRRLIAYVHQENHAPCRIGKSGISGRRLSP
jgi:RimJ/RimL family protein N-acetyltransferase